MQGSLKVHHAFTSPAGRSTRVHLEVQMQVEVFEQSVELGGDRAEGALGAWRGPSELGLDRSAVKTRSPRNRAGSAPVDSLSQ